MCFRLSKNKKTKIKIDDYSKIKIPKDYTMVKISSYNISLNNSVNLDRKIKEIISYIISNFNNKSIDILNLQEINDNTSLHVFIEEFKKYCLTERVKYYFSPPFNNINPSIHKNENHSPTSSIHMIEKSFDSFELSINEKKKKIIHNVIISKYPIVSTIYTELDDETDIDDILGIQILVGANILINNTILSVFNINLSQDIQAAQLINSDVRNTELDCILKVIKLNNKSLQEEAYKQYTKSGITMISGTFNISEINQNNEINDEYDRLISKCHLIDIYRIINEKNHGFTTISKERLNYIFFHMTEDFYEEGSENLDIIMKNKNVDVLKNRIFKRYKLHFFDYYVLESHDNLSTYFPIECVFMISHI
ncbi:hypothetical protein Indivirus_1_130 [Indivirus ILV1]|uniref:Endonuclease/exonuclease/phosphatase family protein n=1 Tax=Indivirus ILV1 TaxID=1977633 RepID=A0A1V0SCR0_9VIRU|nr:hypothetical protein Indivirus_1_130 [Indivirus ILV1]